MDSSRTMNPVEHCQTTSSIQNQGTDKQASLQRPVQCIPCTLSRVTKKPPVEHKFFFTLLSVLKDNKIYQVCQWNINFALIHINYKSAQLDGSIGIFDSLSSFTAGSFGMMSVNHVFSLPGISTPSPAFSCTAAKS